VLAVIWWTTRMLSPNSRNPALSALQKMLETPAGEARGADSRHHADRRILFFAGVRCST